MSWSKLRLAFLQSLCVCCLPVAGSVFAEEPVEPIKLIFDTDLGNDVDDALALGVIHALQSRGQCELLAVTCTKDHAKCAAFADVINTFYGRGQIPIGVVRPGVTPDEGKFLGLATERRNGRDRYPHDLRSGEDTSEATRLLRQVLAEQADGSVVLVQVGFSTNLARLLQSEPDEYSDLAGTALVSRKVRLLSMMAGVFRPIPGTVRHREYNLVEDLASARIVLEQWPTPLVISGFEVGIAVTYPHESIARDYRYVADHPLAEAYRRYCEPDHDRPCWDLTSVLYAVSPEAGYFTLSPPGQIRLQEDGYTLFDERADGKHRYLIVDDHQITRVREALVSLSSQPPAMEVRSAVD
jgi:inosine-uridine nucleoside N-ribohydrolase